MRAPGRLKYASFLQMILATAMVAGIVQTLSACSSSKSPALVGGLNPEEERSANFLSEDPDPTNKDPLRAKLGSFFLVEHFNIEHNPSMDQAIRAHQPGGIVFWNPEHVDAFKVRAVVQGYSTISKASGQPPILFSADYEGGDLGLSPSGRTVAGIQRFKKGFTELAHPIWLGKALEEGAGDEMCRLHAKILAKELKSVGINYPLSVTSDLAMRLFVVRGISKDPKVSVTCLKAMMDVIAHEKNIVFVTKHFPGLGQTLGDSHDTVAMSLAKTLPEALEHLKPFKDVIADVNAKKSWPYYSVMASHGMFPFFDRDAITTESPKILEGLLRKQLHFQGILVSDAMWMGDYVKLSGDRLMATYLKAFLSGMDMLMIPGSKFASAVSFFRSVYDDSASDDQVALAQEVTGLQWDAIRAKFLSRAQASLTNIDRVRSTMKQSIDIMSAPEIEPLSLTVAERARYYELLAKLDDRWTSFLPVQIPGGG